MYSVQDGSSADVIHIILSHILLARSWQPNPFPIGFNIGNDNKDSKQQQASGPCLGPSINTAVSLPTRPTYFCANSFPTFQNYSSIDCKSKFYGLGIWKFGSEIHAVLPLCDIVNLTVLWLALENRLLDMCTQSHGTHTHDTYINQEESMRVYNLLCTT